jgi:hypothetical protein
MSTLRGSRPPLSVFFSRRCIGYLSATVPPPVAILAGIGGGKWWDDILGEHLRGDTYLESIFMAMIRGHDYILGIGAVFNDS